MKKSLFSRLLLLLLALWLVATPALCLTSCGKANPTAASPYEAEKSKEIGTGNATVMFRAVLPDGSVDDTYLHTNAATVGEALLGAGIIAGDEGPYGLYVKTVCGTTLDYDRDGLYWAFYVDGKYGLTGVDTTPIEAGVLYEFRAEKG